MSQSSTLRAIKLKIFNMKSFSTALLLSLSVNLVKGDFEPSNLRKLANEKREGFIFNMADCPGKCLSYDESKVVDLQDCRYAENNKYWSINRSCGSDDSFFQIRHVLRDLCIREPKDCSKCNKDIELVACDASEAAWFSYGNLHKTAPKKYNLYSARCWLNEGLISALSTPSLEGKTCPEDQTVEACQRIEWNVDRFAKDVLYYEFSFNEVKTECDLELFPWQ